MVDDEVDVLEFIGGQLRDGGEVVDARDLTQPEPAVVALVGTSALEADHGGHELAALEMRDVEAFDVEMDNSSSELIDYFIKQSHKR